MGLSSSISFRTNPVDPGSMLPSSAPSGSDEPSAFDRHLDDVTGNDETPADRAAAAREDDRQQTSSSRSTKKSDSSTSSKDDKKADDTTVDASSAVVVAQTQPQANDQPAPAPKGDGGTVTDATGDKKAATPDAAPLAGQSDDAKNAAPVDAAAEAAPADATPSDKTAAIPAAPVAEAAKAEEQAPIAAATLPAAPTEAKTKATPAKSEKAATAPAQPAVPTLPAPNETTAPIAKATTDQTTTDQTQASTTATDPDANLTIKPKEGLGHEAAAHMAEKSDAKGATAQSATQTPTAQAAVAQPATTAATAPKAASSTDAGVPAISAAKSGEGSLTAHLTELQNAGTGSTAANNSATVRIGTLPGQTQPTQVPAMAIALQMARNLQKGSNRFDIRLDPPEMGRIDVRMEIQRDGTVQAHLTVEKPQTLDLLQRDARSLQQALNDAGLQTNSDSLNFSLGDQGSGANAQDYSGTSSSGGQSANNVQANEEAAVTQIYNVNLSATGGVDIRV